MIILKMLISFKKVSFCKFSAKIGKWGIRECVELKMIKEHLV